MTQPDKDFPVAHIRRADDGKLHFHPLIDHLAGTAERAAAHAAPFGGAEWAWLAALWHDLGKFQPEFQAYIRAANDLDAHIEGGAPRRVEHSIAGALLAQQRLDPQRARWLGLLIAGHHAGLPDLHAGDGGAAALQPRLDRGHGAGLLEASLCAAPLELVAREAPTTPPPGHDRAERSEGLHLWLRMLFSALVDADFLHTEGFMDPARGGLRGGYPDIATLGVHLDRRLAELTAAAEPTPVNRLRAEILGHCRAAATEPAGLFSLTVPTGGGKTLSSLAFALDHARAHGKRRVVYVIPYTSIIEQTAEVFRRAFEGLGEVVVEHHSNLEADPLKETPRTRLASENWDAPVIVTTSVQFFESLFAARTGRTRKLHNLADSVVVLDEAQLLPPEFREPILAVLRQLTDHYGVTLLLSTATQPMLGTVESFDGGYRGLSAPREIIPRPAQLHELLRRTRVEWPDDLQTPVEWEALAEELAGHPSVLCIVNLRDDCRRLHALMPPGTIHLSALMCGQHRAEVIAGIKARLKAGEPVRVISTQLVEAGVDIDFPVVYRALAGLDSIAQAAGRCNREGRLDGLGRVKVFVPPSGNYGLIEKAVGATRELLHGLQGDALEPERFARFFHLFYAKIDSDRAGINELLKPDVLALRTVAERFRLIDDGYQRPVFIDYDEKASRLIAQLRDPATGPDRWVMRGLQRYAVNLTLKDHKRLVDDGFIEELYDGIWVQSAPELYDRELGVVLEPVTDAGSLVC
ncbi:CRISPR-associated endonuclease Cas3'' [Endothiovibrio diazotrophicus]